MALPRFNLAESLTGLGRIDEALTEIDAARELWRGLDSPLVAVAALSLGDVHRIRGDAAQAAAAYREAIELGTHHGNAQAVAPAKAGLARTTTLGDAAAARDLVTRMLEQPAALGHVQVQLAAGWIMLCLGDRERAREFGAAAEEEGAKRHDARGVAEALEILALADDPALAFSRLAEAEAIWDAVESPIFHARNAVITARLNADRRTEDAARARLRSLGVRDAFFRIAGPLMAIGDPAPPALSIRTLGAFALFRSEHVVPVAEWQSRKARELVKLLCGRDGRPITRDEAGALLWPQASGSTANRLSVLLSNIRSIFDPERSHDADFFLVADRDALHLDLEHVHVDADEFRARAHAALQTAAADDAAALGQLQEAAAQYTGHFVEEDPYAAWAVPIREELHGLSIAVRREIARILVVEGQSDAAIAWLIGLLADDPYDVPVNHTLIKLLVAAGRHGEARRFHGMYRGRMAEIGAEPIGIEAIVQARMLPQDRKPPAHVSEAGRGSW